MQHRAIARLQLHHPQPATSLGTAEEELHNISGGGCFVHTAEELQIGSEYEFSIPVPTGEPIVRAGRIVWHRALEGENEMRGYGVQFVDSDANAAAEVLQACLVYDLKTVIRQPL